MPDISYFEFSTNCEELFDLFSYEEEVEFEELTIDKNDRMKYIKEDGSTNT